MSLLDVLMPAIAPEPKGARLVQPLGGEPKSTASERAYNARYYRKHRAAILKRQRRRRGKAD